jgi:hypothetical protein
MNSILVILAVVGTWLMWALVEVIVGELLRPLIDPIFWFFGRLLNLATLFLLWVLAIGSLFILSPALESNSPTLRWLGALLFMTCLPLAVGATITFLNRNRRPAYGFPAGGPDAGRRTG